jgi:hypothetical protein
LAEARVPEINRLLEQLVAVQIINETALLGDVVISRLYSALYAPADSGQVLVAALLLPGGFGVVLYDSEELAQLEQSPCDGHKITSLNFQPFDACEPAIRALLLPHLEPLLDRLCAMIRLPRDGSHPT